jgi:pyruvate,water dikinase
MPGPDGPKSPDEIGAEFGRRAGVAAEALATRRWLRDLAEWDTVCKPASIARIRELTRISPAQLDDDGLCSHLLELRDHVAEMAYQHHRFNVATLLPLGDFALHVAGWLHIDPKAALPVFDGYSPLSQVAAEELTDVLAALRADPEAEALVRGDGDAESRLTALRARCPAVAEYLELAGCRLVEGFDIDSPTVEERPALFLGRLAAALDAPSGESLRRSDAYATALRERVDPAHHAEFDELLADARALYRLRDERGVYSDGTAFGLVRRAMLETGRRLVERGSLRDAPLALEATVEELVSMLKGGGPTDADLQARRETRERLAAMDPPRHLGPPAPPPPPIDQLPPPLARVMGSVMFAIDGVLGEHEHPLGDDTTIVGIPVSDGIYEGRARVVRSIDDLWNLEQGDVLVALATSESFNTMLHLVGAIVTNHGSHSSHAAIVSKEMGIPAVVGTVNGTERIRDGARVRVDGSAGEVTVLD